MSIIESAETSRAGTAKKKTNNGRSKPFKFFAGATAVTLGASSAFLIATPAIADPGYSEATAQYLSGSLVDYGLENIANVEGTEAQVPLSSTDDVVDVNDLNLTVLGGVLTLTAPGGIQIPIDITDAGVIGQYSEANADGSSRSASGLVNDDGVVGVGPDAAAPPGSLTLDLSDLLGTGVTSEITGLYLETGVNTATATQTGAAPATGDYAIAGLGLSLDSPLVADLTGAVSDATVPLQTTLDAVVGPTGSLVTGITDLVSTPGVVDATATLDADLPTVVDGVLASNQVLGAGGPVVLDLANGTVDVDVDALLVANGMDLNNLTANTEVLNTQLVGFITAEVDDLVNGLLDTVNDAVTLALEAAILDVNVTVGDPADPTLLVDVTGSLADVASGAAVPTVTGLDSAAAGPLVAALLQTVAGTLSAVELDVPALTLPIEGLYPALDTVLSDVISLTANGQETVDGTFTQTSLSLGLLGLLATDGSVLELNLAQATVGPNALVVDPANPDTVIVSFTPATGPDTGGTEVTLTGTGFTGVDEVLFGANPATDVEVISDTALVATSPAGTGSVPITVTGGTYGDFTSLENFTYIPTAFVTSFSPISGSEDGGTEVTIVGNGFDDVTDVLFGTTPAADVEVISDTTVIATSPAGTGNVPLTVVGTSSGDLVTEDDFIYLEEGVGAISGFTPTEGPTTGGTEVTITGMDFTDVTEVLFGTTPATDVEVISDEEIIATSPAGTGNVLITVVGTSTGDVVSAEPFEYVLPGDIAAITPAAGPTSGGTEVIIGGTGFTGADDVLFGGSSSSTFEVISDTEIRAVTPAGQSGLVDVTIVGTDNGDIVEEDGFAYELTPVISTFTPDSGPATGGTVVVIIGSGFTGAEDVLFGENSATAFEVISDTEIRATSPAGSGDVAITVVSADGTPGTSLATFAYGDTTPAAVGGPAASGDLPFTGFANAGLIGLALAGLLGGAALMFSARRLGTNS